MLTSPRVAILNNEIMPYRIPLFEQLAARQVIRPRVLYCTRRSPEREWSLDLFERSYPHKVLPGWALSLHKPPYNERRYIWINPTLLYELFRLKPEVIIGYEYSVPALTALLYSRLTGCRYITWTEMTAHAGRSLTRGQRLTRRIIIPRSHSLIGTSRAACDNLVTLGAPPERVVLGPQPLDVRWLEARSGRLRSQLPAHPPTILYTGSLIPRKGVEHLLAAFRHVLEEVPDAVLRIGGSGALRMPLQQMAREMGIASRVEFLGFVQPDRLPEVYASSDVFVLPSLEDTFAVVAAEALACGLGLVCSRYVGFSSHLIDGHNGFIVDPLDHREMANRTVTLLTDAGLRQQFHASSRVVLDEIDPAHVAAQFEEAVRVALEQG